MLFMSKFASWSWASSYDNLGAEDSIPDERDVIFSNINLAQNAKKSAWREQHICSNWACSDPSHDIISSYYNENTFQISTEYWLIWYRMAGLPSIFHIKRKFFLKGGIFPSTPDKQKANLDSDFLRDTSTSIKTSYQLN